MQKAILIPRDEATDAQERQEIAKLRRIAFEQVEMAHERSKTPGMSRHEQRADAVLIDHLMDQHKDYASWFDGEGGDEGESDDDLGDECEVGA